MNAAIPLIHHLILLAKVLSPKKCKKNRFRLPLYIREAIVSIEKKRKEMAGS